MKTRLHLLLVAVCLGLTISAQNQKLWTVCKTGGPQGWGTILAMANDGSSAAVAHQFDWTYGATPMGNLVLASDGNIYGTCYDGGSFSSCVVFRYAPSTDIYTDIWDFDIVNGDFPQSGMVEGNNGKLYGAASSGGATGGGVIYSVDLATSNYTPVVTLDPSTGTMPIGAPIRFGNMLLGLTSAGGPYNAGVLYSYDYVNNVYTVLHQFNGTTDGGAPNGSLYFANDGKFYGLCSTGGASNEGTLFSYEPFSGTFTVHHSFASASGGTPYASVMQASNGKLYGTTSQGGAGNLGVIFSYDPVSGLYTNEYGFTLSTGNYPASDLSQDNMGNIYGTAMLGGTFGDGTMFKFDPVSHTCSVMWNFNSVSSGSSPNGGVMITDATVGVHESTPVASAVSVYPNPVRDNSVITLNLDHDANVTLDLYDSRGSLVRSISSGNMMAGEHRFDLHAKDLDAGIYFAVLDIDGKRSSSKVVVE